MARAVGPPALPSISTTDGGFISSRKKPSTANTAPRSALLPNQGANAMATKNNPHNLPQRTIAAIEALTEEQLVIVRRNIRGREYNDEETREAVAQYVADGGEISDLLEAASPLDLLREKHRALCRSLSRDEIQARRAGK